MNKKEGQTSIAKVICTAYETFLNLSPDEIGEVGIELAIPLFTEAQLMELCQASIEHLKRWNALVQIRAPIYVVGDLHGNIFDLIRIFIFCGRPPASRFLFLGDYVDRGSYSVEVISLLLSMAIQYPGYIILLRGNHEFTSINNVYGFHDEISNVYSNDLLFSLFNEVFSWLPIAATVNDSIFCVHGGLSPLLTSLKDFNSFPRPLQQCDHNVISDLVWSDPSRESPDFVRSKRGSGVLFGDEALANFLKETNMTKVIRAHQCVQLGIEKFAGESLYTVFSCSNYADASNNRCGIVFITPDLELQTFSLPPGVYMARENAKIEPYGTGKSRKITTTTNNGSMSVSISMQQLSNTMLGSKKLVPAARRSRPFISVHNSMCFLTKGQGTGSSVSLPSLSD